MTENDLLDTLYSQVEELPLREIIDLYPCAANYLRNYRLENIELGKTFLDALADTDQSILSEFGMSPEDLSDQLAEFIFAENAAKSTPSDIKTLTVIGGTDKQGNPENAELTLCKGDVVSLVGPTGSGKSRLLEDIECLAIGDTPTKRKIMINGRFPDDEERMAFSGHLIALLSQNMNFVIDLSVEDFLRMHASVRGGTNQEERIRKCVCCANDLSGEPFDRSTKVTQLSGGQSRALMIADAALISDAPIILIDEIENAGVDRVRAINILVDKGKIVLLSTHDPILALSAQKRIVLRNGAISDIIVPDEAERALIPAIREMDRRLSEMRNLLRNGKRINSKEAQKNVGNI